jgi:hypothetical protein
MSVRAVLGALQAVAATAVECELTRDFGVDWIPRADGRGNEIRGISQAQLDAYSTRTVQVREKERELARAWERKHGRAPTSRERTALLETDYPDVRMNPHAQLGRCMAHSRQGS